MGSGATRSSGRGADWAGLSGIMDEEIIFEIFTNGELRGREEITCEHSFRL
jgi:hypothetical protein